MEIYIGNPLNGDKATVDPQGRLQVASTSFTRYEQASEDGKAFNSNTEYVAISSAGENATFYMKNTADSDLIIEAWFWGVENLTGGAPTGNPVIRSYFNPTGGTLLSDAVAVPVINRNGGSSETFGEITAYKASGTGKTITGVSDPVLFQLQGSGRTFGTIRLTLPKNSSIAFTIDLAGYASADVYSGVTGFFKD